MRLAAALISVSCLSLVACGRSSGGASTAGSVPESGKTLEQLWRDGGRRRRRGTRDGSLRSGRRSRLVPRRRLESPSDHSPEGGRLARPCSWREAVPRGDGDARVDRRSRRSEGRRHSYLRRPLPGEQARDVLAPRGAAGWSRTCPRGRERRRPLRRPGPRHRCSGAGVGDADTCERGRRRGAGDDSDSARHLAFALLRRRVVAREDPVRRDVRDAQVL